MNAQQYRTMRRDFLRLARAACVRTRNRLKREAITARSKVFQGIEGARATHRAAGSLEPVRRQG